MKAKIVSFDNLNKFLEDKDFVEKIERVQGDFYAVYWSDRKVWNCDTSQLTNKEKMQFMSFFYKLKWSNP